MSPDTRQIFLQCLSDFVHGKATLCPATDWAALFDLAARHSVDGIIYHQCRGSMPQDTARKYLSRYLGDVVYSLKREEVTTGLIRLFEEAHIPSVFIKGASVREYYPVAPLRSMGDIDFVIKPEDRKKADSILKEKLGFDCFVDNHSVWTYWKDNLYIEIHDHLFYEQLANKTDYQKFFDQVWEHCHNAKVFGVESADLLVPDEDFHFLYLVAHTAKHVLNNGAGFRAYLDLALMTKECEASLNWSRIAEELDDLKLLTFAKTCCSCCEKWFGVEMPLRLELLDKGLFEAITDKTFRDGVFGLENAENGPASAAKDIRRSSSPYFVAAVKRGFRRLFPPYRDLQLVPWYSWIDGKPWLLPAAWIYRFFYCGAKKLKHGVKYLIEPFSKKKDVLKRQDFMKEWGL